MLIKSRLVIFTTLIRWWTHPALEYPHKGGLCPEAFRSQFSAVCGILSDCSWCGQVPWHLLAPTSIQMKSLLCFSSQTESREHIVAFNMLNYRSCKNLWKSCVEHHTFFQAKKLLPQEKNVLSQYWTLGARNPKKWVYFGLHTRLKCKLGSTGRWTSVRGRDAITQRPQPPDLGLLGDLRTMVESLLGGDSVSFCTYPDTAHVPITCFCLLNAAVLRAPKEPELQLLPRHVTIREARGSDSGLLWCLAYGLSWHLATKTASPAEH